MKLLLVLLFTFSLSAFTKDRSQWTMNDHWEQTQLEFKTLIYGVVNQENCTASVKKLLGCVAVINKAKEMMDPSKKILVVYSLNNDEEQFTEVDYSHLNQKEFFKIKQQYFQELYTELTSVEKTLNLIAFDSGNYLASFEISVINEANDSMVSGQLMNEYLAVAEDPHTYIIPTSYMEDRSKPAAKKVGMGIYFHLDKIDGREVYVLDEVIENSPAEKYGLKRGDALLSVNGKTDAKEAYEQISKQNILNLVVLRGDEKIKINMVKGHYEVKNVNPKLLIRDGKKYGYIKLRHFSDNSACGKIKESATRLLAAEIEGFILDLRNNGGGLVTQMKCISMLYLEDGSRTWAVRYLDQEDENVLIETKAHETDNILGNIHTVTLINGHSASASEATAMYLKDYRKTFVVGEQSFGKGTMQGIERLPNYLNLSRGKTMAVYYGPKGLSPQVDGVSPDIEVFPNAMQTEATPYEREADRYLFVVDNEIDASEVEEADRKREVKEVKRCIKREGTSFSRYYAGDKAVRRVFDNQLEKSFDVLACANKHVEINRNIDIPTVEGVEFMSQWDYMLRGMRKMKPIKPKVVPSKPAPKLKPISQLI
jgi:C-terminal peptidase prc